MKLINVYPFCHPNLQNATIAEYGTYSFIADHSDIVHKLQSEIYARGPVATGVNAEPIVKYTGGRVDDTKIWHMMVNHIVSIVGWETDPDTGNVYWIVRNSWGKSTITAIRLPFVLAKISNWQQYPNNFRLFHLRESPLLLTGEYWGGTLYVFPYLKDCTSVLF